MNMYGRMNSSSTQDTYYPQYKSAQMILEKCNLLQYLPVFIAEGFDSIEAINEITEEDLSEMGVKRGHRRVLQRAIATEKGIPVYQPLSYLVSNPTSSINTNFGWETVTNENASSGSSSGGGAYSSTSGYGSMSSSQPSSTTPLRYCHSKSDIVTDMSDSVHNDEAIIKEIANSSYSSNEDLEEEEEEMIEDEDEEEEEEEEEDEEECNIQRKYRRHPKRDKNAPIKPPSAYIMFSNDARTQLKDQNMSFVEIAKYVGDSWKNLDPDKKKEYERTAMRGKDLYIDRLNQYRKTPEYKKYQAYLKDFKSKQDAMNRKIARSRKLAKLESANSSNNGTNNNNDRRNDNNNNNNTTSSSSNFVDSFNDPEIDESSLTTGEGGSSTSSGSSDIYKVHREKLKNRNTEDTEDGYSPQPMNIDSSPKQTPFVENKNQQSSSSRRNLRSLRQQ